MLTFPRVTALRLSVDECLCLAWTSAPRSAPRTARSTLIYFNTDTQEEEEEDTFKHVKTLNNMIDMNIEQKYSL